MLDLTKTAISICAISWGCVLVQVQSSVSTPASGGYAVNAAGSSSYSNPHKRKHTEPEVCILTLCTHASIGMGHKQSKERFMFNLQGVDQAVYQEAAPKQLLRAIWAVLTAKGSGVRQLQKAEAYEQLAAWHISGGGHASNMAANRLSTQKLMCVDGKGNWKLTAKGISRAQQLFEK